MWKVSKYGVFPRPYFPVFGLNTGKYGPEKSQTRIWTRFMQCTDWIFDEIFIVFLTMTKSNKLLKLIYVSYDR